MDKGNLSPSVAGLKIQKRGNYLYYRIEALDCPIHVINNSPRHAVISSRAITGKYTTDVSVYCLLSMDMKLSRFQYGIISLNALR